MISNTQTGKAPVLATKYIGHNLRKVNDAETMSLEAMKMSRKQLVNNMKNAEQHNDGRTSMQLRDQCKEAKQLQVQVIEERKRVLSAEHLNTLISI